MFFVKVTGKETFTKAHYSMIILGSKVRTNGNKVFYSLMMNTLVNWLKADFISFMITLNPQIPGAFNKGATSASSL